MLEDTGVSPLEFAGVLREEIKEKTKCNASAGLGKLVCLSVRLSTFTVYLVDRLSQKL